jgi:hypothetical protein
LQTNEAGFQLSFLEWGTTAAKSRRACLSDFRSEIAKGKMMVRMMNK